MDRGARDRIVSGRIGRGMPSLLLLALLLLQAGCHRAAREAPPLPPPGPEERPVDNTTAAVPEWLHPAVPTDLEKEAAGPPEAVEAPAGNAAVGVPQAVAPGLTPLPGARGADDTSPPPAVARPAPPPAPGAAAGGTSPPEAVPSALATKPPPAPRPEPAAPPTDARGASLPGWAKHPEELVYRVDFIGITMGYARFRYDGKVAIAGKQAFHLNVRAWTSGVLAYIFPINETIDYYLDAETLAPIRQEFTQRERGKDDVALYDQETGRITYRYRQSGKIRKQVDTVPSVYDPVSVAYYFRWRDLGAENRPRNVYAGRKLYQISSRVLGNERIRMDHGEVDTIAVLPLIRRDGKPDDKGDLKIWFSADERRVPVRLYAKFHKIKDWTLVGELMPPAGRAGG